MHFEGSSHRVDVACKTGSMNAKKIMQSTTKVEYAEISKSLKCCKFLRGHNHLMWTSPRFLRNWASPVQKAFQIFLNDQNLSKHLPVMWAQRKRVKNFPSSRTFLKHFLYKAWNYFHCEIFTRSVPVKWAWYFSVSVPTTRIRMARCYSVLKVLTICMLGHTIFKCKNNLTISPSTKAQNAAISKNQKFIFRATTPHFCIRLGPSPSRKHFKCFWATEIDQSMFELCERKENVVRSVGRPGM